MRMNEWVWILEVIKMSDFTVEEYRGMLYRFTELDSKDRERLFGCCFLVNVVEKFTPSDFMKKMREFIGTPKPFEIWEHKTHDYKVVILNVDNCKVFVLYLENYSLPEGIYELDTFSEIFEKVGDSEGIKKLIEELE